ncbi:MAG: hypothetical protein HJJLKODD_02606 [Phycisphaerae bacterium]|nr:hypothetical protein [Phycisphaerae bacterium]
MRFVRIFLLLFIIAWSNAAAQAQSITGTNVKVTDDEVNRLIEQLVNDLKVRQKGFTEIEINGPIKLLSTGELINHDEVTTYQGTIIEENESRITFRTISGMTFTVERKHVTDLRVGGEFNGEQPDNNQDGGRTALATFALISAGVSRHDPIMANSLGFLKKHRMPGTYGRALRASIYSTLVSQSSNPEERESWRKLLERDARWLVLAMNDSNGYTYTTHADESNSDKTPFTIYDNSNSQFGNLGVWIATLSGYAAPRGYWMRVAKFWLEQQDPSGGWAYKAKNRPSENMTIAGVNSLIMVLDQYYAKAAGKYEKFKGITSNPRILEEIETIQNSVLLGLHWLSMNGRPYGEAYTQLGTERLGLASGEKYFGGRDWYRVGAAGAVNNQSWEGRSLEDVSMWLIFLSYGRAPVLINKLRWGGDESNWDYYFRDIYHVCRFISNTYEEIYKWQIVDAKSTLYDLEDAPLLFIGGDDTFWFPEGFDVIVREYLENGGTIIGHANLASAKFANSFKSVFEKLLADVGYKFRQLPKNHPIYKAGFSEGTDRIKEHIPIWGLSDGYREVVLLFPVDVAGAWHQSLYDDQVDLFRIMANIRLYAARRYQELPGRLRGERLTGRQARAWGSMRVLRPKSSVDLGGAWGSLKQMNLLMTHYYGLSLRPVDKSQLQQLPATSSFDMLHIMGQGEKGFTSEELQAIKAYCQSGGFVFIESAGGDLKFTKQVKAQLSELFKNQFQSLNPENDLLKGQFGQGKPLNRMEYTRWAKKEGFKGETPALWGVQQNGDLVLVFSPLDVSVAAGRQYVFGTIGFDESSAQKVMRNILLYRFGQLQRKTNPQAQQPVK